MSYENPEVPHDVNVSRESAIVEFVRLAVGVAIVAAVVAALLYFGGGALARLVPFETEREWVGERVFGFDVDTAARTPRDAEIEAYLQRLAEDLAARMDLPAAMTLRVHYAHTDVPNAFATLGGHVIVTSGLYARMPSENALATVLAHEIGHVKARDPISAVGGSASLALVMVLLGGSADRLAPYVGRAVLLGYSRRAERRADDEAIAAVRARYGHAGGSAAVFEVLRDYAGGARVPSLLSTHPADEERIARMRSAAKGWDPARRPLRPLAVAAEPAR